MAEFGSVRLDKLELSEYLTIIGHFESSMPFEPSSLLDVSHLVTFVGGAIVGGAGQYLADRFTDQRRKQLAKSEAKKQFSALKAVMPKLFAEMVQDLNIDQSQSIREFVITPNRRVSFNGSKPRFMYYEDEHPDVRVHVDRLLEAGYLQDVTVGNVPIYRLREHFVLLLNESA